MVLRDHTWNHNNNNLGASLHFPNFNCKWGGGGNFSFSEEGKSVIIF